MTELPTLCIGDVHGHFYRLRALLEQEGIIDADGERINRDVRVVQVGDLGQFSSDTAGRDHETWDRVWTDEWVDVVLWGNHDRAVVDKENHQFGGYGGYLPETFHIMKAMQGDGRLKLATAAHGWLITHAGLHAEWQYNKAPKGLKRKNPYEVADWLNQFDFEPQTKDPVNAARNAIVNAVGSRRGGWANHGGILWRDFEEKLYKEMPQVFGHSASRHHVVRNDPSNLDSYCIDVGGRGDREGDNCLAGIWLPDKKIVRVDLEQGTDEVKATAASS